jgi:hypothetical protein
MEFAYLDNKRIKRKRAGRKRKQMICCFRAAISITNLLLAIRGPGNNNTEPKRFRLQYNQ